MPFLRSGHTLKEKGIQHYNQRAWHSATLMLQQAADMLQNADDAASLGSVWYYQGRVAQAMHGTATAKAYFLKPIRSIRACIW